MCEPTIQKLSTDTVKLITSTQIITSVATAIKELFENSIDAGAKVIQVRLENFGLDLIEVKDDGSGVSYDNVQKMFLPGFTSKIRQFEDLDKLQTYGFRGEALAAICKVAKVSITTKTKQDALAMSYEIDAAGVPVSSKPSHLNTGTIITISSLFSNLPVRRLSLSSKKKMSEELKKAEYTVQSLSLVHPELAVMLIHNKCPVWRKNSVKGIKQSFMQVAGLKVASKMDLISKTSNNVTMDLLVPRKNLDNVENVFTNSNLNMYVYINKRPLNCKILSQTVQEHIFNHFNKFDISFRYAVCLISVNVPPQEIDINLEPNKTKVFLKNQIQIIRLIDESLKNYYEHDFMCKILKESNLEGTADEGAQEQQSKRPRLELPKRCETEKSPQKNKDWDVEIIDDDLNGSTEKTNCISEPKSLCSQINCDNSVLTREEVSEFNVAVSEASHKLVISKSGSDGEGRLLERNDIQARGLEKPILKEWPSRPKTDAPQSLSQFGSSLSEAENKKVEEIAAEIEKSAQEWSSEMMKAMKTHKNEEKLGDEIDLRDENIQMFDLSMQSVSSQMGKKELKAFTKFARIMRPKIVEEFPNIKFTQVAGILADRWKALSSDEVKYYEKMADVVEINRKSHQEVKQMESRKPPEKSSNSHPQNTNLKSLFDRMKKKSKISRPLRREVFFPVSIDEIKEVKEKPETQPENIQIIGQLQPSGNWVYLRGNEMGHVRHQGLQELIAFQKMLSSFSVPKKKVEKSILVNEENLGTVLWNVLIALDSEYEVESSRCVITSDVITKNGFRVEIFKNGEVVCDVHITEVAESIPHFGIQELKEILSMYQKNGDFGGLASWRPTSVYNFITNEAIRLAQQSTGPPDRLEMEDMINTYHLCFRHLPPVCLHSKDIFPVFYNVQDELPESPDVVVNLTKMDDLEQKPKFTLIVHMHCDASKCYRTASSRLSTDNTTNFSFIFINFLDWSIVYCTLTKYI